MPYTPPSQRSPATSKPNSPILSRAHSYTAESGPAQKPSLPRSVSSTSYISKHRRSPSLSTQNTTAANGQPAASSVGSSAGARRHGSSSNGGIRPTPYVSKRLMPPGAVTTPPDSSEDEEDSRGRNTGGRNIGNLRELHEALQHIDVKREHSPNRDESSESKAPRMPVQPLSAEARKMSHSRSASEITLSMHAAQLSLNTHPIINSSSENSDVEDDELRIKPPLLRKKSGELVKPALRPAHHRRPSSMPGTPTFAKAVHFGDNVEQVRHFNRSERPMAVSAGSSPVETYDDDSDYPWGYEDGHRTNSVEWEITLSNFPADTFERKVAPVRVEKIFLAFDHKTLIGTVAVKNMSFHKLVVARFTLDFWKTTSEVVAEYNHDVRKKQASDGDDRFNFNIKLVDLANLESKTMFLCVRYNVNGQEYWDNNNSMNYQIDFTKKTKAKGNGRPSHGLDGQIPRSRQSPPGRPRSIDDDFDFEFGNVGRFKLQSPTGSIRLKPKSKRGGSFLPDEATSRNPSAQAFSSRYDFLHSLTAPTASRPAGSAASTGGAAGGRPTSTSASVPGLPADKPSVESPEYNELLQKYCFYGTPTGKGSTKTAVPVRNDSVTNGYNDQLPSGSTSGSSQSSASNSPASPALSAYVDGANDAISSNSQHFLSRSTSPGPVTGSDMIHSPIQYGYSMHGGIFPERSPTPQACV